jgi:hypothetical protein
MSHASAAFSATESISYGSWDPYLTQLRIALADRQRVLEDPEQAPPKTAEMIASGHQTWVWMHGPGKPHWEIRGTGVVF